MAISMRDLWTVVRGTSFGARFVEYIPKRCLGPFFVATGDLVVKDKGKNELKYRVVRSFDDLTEPHPTGFP